MDEFWSAPSKPGPDIVPLPWPPDTSRLYKYMNEVGTNLMKTGFGREMIGRMTQMNAATSTWAATGGQVVGPLGSLTSMGLQVGMYRKLTKSLGQVGGASTKAASVTAAKILSRGRGIITISPILI